MAELVDQAQVLLRAGRGGDGASHFLREKYAPRGGPDGGDGGRGGDVILAVDDSLSTLVEFRYRSRFEAEDGAAGAGKNWTGSSGADLIVNVPPGTLVRDVSSEALLADLASPGDRFTVCRGGRGGRGNAAFKSATHQAPTLREKGEPGEEREVVLELKLLADIALVGFPNAGKSTLISRLSAAKPKVASYPFTTLTPHLGVVRLGDDASFVLADLPGLIEGAAEGRGLGHTFLKHLERARAIVHLVDLSGFERPDPIADYQAIRDELLRYDEGLAALPELVALNKIDLPDGPELAEIVTEELNKLGVERILPISAVSGAGCDALVHAMAELLRSDEAQSLVARRAEAVVDLEDEPEDDGPGFAVEALEDGYYRVTGAEVERAMAMCDVENDEAVMRLHRLFVRLGVLEALRAAGCGDGDAVVIGDVILDFQD